MRKFKDVKDFAQFMQSRALPALPSALHRGVEDGSNLILKTVQAQIGHYLDGPEPGLPTAPLAKSTIDDRIRKGFTPDDPGLRTGEMRDSYGVRIDEAGQTVAASIGSDDIKAIVFELGRWEQGNYQPPRPELSIAAMRNEDKVVAGVARLVTRALSGRPLPNAPASEAGE